MDIFWLATMWSNALGLGQAPNFLLGPCQVQRVNHRLHGQVVGFTRQGLKDYRIWSPALGQKRNLIVYLPPGFDQKKRYPLVLFLHGAAQDEGFFLQSVVKQFDTAIHDGKMPPAIIAAPDGSIHGRATLFDLASFWADSKAGLFEKYLMVDVWDFLHENFPLRVEREAKAVIGVSMGGSAAMRLGIQYRDRIKAVICVMPLLNLRYCDCHGRYRSKFDPQCYALLDDYRGMSPLGRRRFFTLHNFDLYRPLFGRGRSAIEGMSRINPLELMEREGLRPGELDIYIGYGAKDEFNVAAQVESFVYFAKKRGIEMQVDVDPHGGHNLQTGRRLMPRMAEWSMQRVKKGQ
jgi:pimeloyl-ACP methyl ester carboxylesterase